MATDKHDAANNEADNSSGGGVVTCAVCLSDLSDDDNDNDNDNDDDSALGSLPRKAHLPCCFRPRSSDAVCLPCMRTIINMTGTHIGRCPLCRSYVQFASGSSSEGEEGAQTAQLQTRLEKAVPHGRCAMCMQTPRIIVRGGICDACDLGVNNRLRYACTQCERIQVIPHPMWRYMETPTSASTVTWACHGECQTYTTWTVWADDVERIPPEDTPESWGRRERWLADVRAERERRRQEEERGEVEWFCTIA